jgi:molecular chaperone DnaJ
LFRFRRRGIQNSPLTGSAGVGTARAPPDSCTVRQAISEAGQGERPCAHVVVDKETNSCCPLKERASATVVTPLLRPRQSPGPELEMSTPVAQLCTRLTAAAGLRGAAWSQTRGLLSAARASGPVAGQRDPCRHPRASGRPRSLGAQCRPLASGASSASSASSSARRDYYTVLGVSRNASAADLKKVYYKLAKQHHPDASGGDPARFAEINSAYEVLSDPGKRRLYDDFGHDGVAAADAGADPRARTASPEDILRDFGAFFSGGGVNMGGMSQRSRRSVDDPEPGTDKQAVATLEFMEAATGVQRSIRVSAARTCGDCHGSGKNRNTSIVKCSDCNGEGHVAGSGGLFGMVIMTCGRCDGAGDILKNPCGNCSGLGTVGGIRETPVSFPAGTDNGMVLRVPGAGDDGIRGGTAGDLYIQVRVKEDDYFHRENKNLHVVAPISVSQAALGGHVRVRTVDGEEEVAVSPGTQSDDTAMLRGRGLRSVNSSRRGDQKVHFKVVIPTRLSGKQKELLEELANLDGGKIMRPGECRAPGLLRRFQRFLKATIGVGST